MATKVMSDSRTEQLLDMIKERFPLLMQTDAGSDETPVALIDGLLKECNTSSVTAASVGAAGYVKFSNGFIFQWSYGNNVDTVNLPISFSTSTSYQAVVSGMLDNNANVYTYSIGRNSASQIFTANSSGSNHQFFFMAAGY